MNDCIKCHRYTPEVINLGGGVNRSSLEARKMCAFYFFNKQNLNMIPYAAKGHLICHKI